MTNDHNHSSTHLDDQIVPVFWTGGWDSTHRVVDLVVHYGCRVQPIYVVDESRRSRHIEMEVMDRIRHHIEVERPDSAGLLAETMYLNSSDIEIPGLENHPFLELAREASVSRQYLYLSGVPDVTGFANVEVAIHSKDNASTFAFLRERVRSVQLDNGAITHEIEPWEPASQYEYAMKVFERFRLPYLFLDPNELEVIAEKHGLNRFLNLTFTCRMPMGAAPCGVCETCRLAIEAGKTAHFSKSALLRYRFAPVLNPIWITINNPKGALAQVARRLRR